MIDTAYSKDFSTNGYRNIFSNDLLYFILPVFLFFIFLKSFSTHKSLHLVSLAAKQDFVPVALTLNSGMSDIISSNSYDFPNMLVFP